MELLVAAPMALILLVATLTVHLSSTRQQERTDVRVHTLIQQRQGLERMTRELREAVDVLPASSVAVEATIWSTPAGGGPAVQRRVRYDCTAGACDRLEGAVGGTLSPSPGAVVTDVVNADVFDFQPDLVNPDYVTITLEVAVRGAPNPIALRDGVSLRNLTRES
jgi:hypothetical protein